MSLYLKMQCRDVEGSGMSSEKLLDLIQLQVQIHDFMCLSDS